MSVTWRVVPALHVGRLHFITLLPGSRAFQIHLQHFKRVQADARGQAILFVGAKALTVQETFQVVKGQLAGLFLLVHRPKVLYATNNQLLIHPIQVDCFDEDPNSGQTRITMSDGQSISVVETLSEIEQGLTQCQLRQAIKAHPWFTQSRAY